MRSRLRGSHPIARILEGDLLSPLPGPEELCMQTEVQAWISGLLARLQSRSSPTTYEAYCRRFVSGQSIDEIATALSLTPEEVRYRCYRVSRKLRQLAKDQGRRSVNLVGGIAR